MTGLKQSRLILFFTRGVSLRTWDKVGMFEREMALYERLQENGVRVSFVTYGDATDLRYADQLDGIQIMCNRWRLPQKLYAYLAPWLFQRQMLQADVLRTNQMIGSEVAVRAKQLYGRRMIARCGYLWSDFAERETGPASASARRARRAEARAFQIADQAVVTTQDMREHVVERYGVPPEKICVIPNYILTDLFRPRPELRRPGTVFFVGRLEEQKNPLALLEALHGLDVQLLMIGRGSLRPSLEAKAKARGLDVTFLERVPHTELPAYMNQASVFVQPSLYEGHPKTLLEAMSCGLPVVGTDVPGIRELIQHRQNGYLCGTSPIEIRAAIQEVLSSGQLQREMGRNAREFVVANFSLERILELELALLSSLVAEG